MGLTFQWQKMNNKQTIDLKHIKPGSKVGFLPVIPVDLYRVFKKFKTLKYLTIIRETVYKQHIKTRSFNFCLSTSHCM